MLTKTEESQTQALTQPQQSVLTDQLLLAFEGRVRRYDQQNAFFTEDFEELRKVG